MIEQQLSERNYIHTQECSSSSKLCDSVIKQSCEVGTVLQNLKTSDNNPDEALTPTAQGEQDLRVPAMYVLNIPAQF